MTKKQETKNKFNKLIQDMEKPGLSKQEKEQLGDLARKQINKLYRYSCKKSKR